MTVNLALEYIPKRMNELGYGSNYYIRFRHLVLKPSETRKLDADNQYYFLVEDADNISVTSDFGIFDLSQENTNEMLYEHTGKISLHNYASTVNHLRFIQVIPKREDNTNNGGK